MARSSISELSHFQKCESAQIELLGEKPNFRGAKIFWSKFANRTFERKIQGVNLNMSQSFFEKQLWFFRSYWLFNTASASSRRVLQFPLYIGRKRLEIDRVKNIFLKNVKSWDFRMMAFRHDSMVQKQIYENVKISAIIYTVCIFHCINGYGKVRSYLRSKL